MSLLSSVRSTVNQSQNVDVQNINVAQLQLEGIVFENERRTIKLSPGDAQLPPIVGDNNIIIGDNVTVPTGGVNFVGIGNNCVVPADNTIAIGRDSNATYTSLILGYAPGDGSATNIIPGPFDYDYVAAQAEVPLGGLYFIGDPTVPIPADNLSYLGIRLS